MDTLETLLLALLVPPGPSFALGLLALVLAVSGIGRAAVIAGGLAWGSLYGSALPPVADRAMAYWEQPFPQVAPADSPRADLIVLLGGGVRGPNPPVAPQADLTESGDRVLHAAALWQAGRAPRILVLTPGGAAEGTVELLVRLGVAPEAIVLDRRGLTTRQEARVAAERLPELRANRVLLVTSAFHMRRAMANFEAAGLSVLPAATDHRAGRFGERIPRWLPHAQALEWNATVAKEALGLAHQRLLGSP